MTDTPMPWEIPGAPHPRDFGPRTRRIYIASSWRNQMQQATVHVLRAAGFDVYDFKEPERGRRGFSWDQVGLVDHNQPVDEVPIGEYLEALQHAGAVAGFASDLDAMKNADTFVLVLPCGRSAHLELGWAVGAGKRTCIYAPQDALTPELMYKMVDHIAPTMMDLLAWLGVKDNDVESGK